MHHSYGGPGAQPVPRPELQAFFGEPVAFRLGEDLRGPEVDGHTVRAAVSEVLVELEVIDTPYGDWRLPLQGSVADNAAAARSVPGREIPLHPDLDLACEEITVRVGREAVAPLLGRRG
ncbi:hypothetical protein SRB17_49350 [Streptomyces sp. RB17]|uniref:hypothetical protein n=1 Tax=Streptomyces sp. RB17 TaxID=2585197 RepID=UPI001295FA19|nr:hypothetical protein [Streptomyces sp. RB17]MQY36933.1 hypothetical protein [Streptomyces sp. RB17]